MKVPITRRRLAILTAIHDQGETRASGICAATDLGPGYVYPVLDLFQRAGWIGRRPDPARPSVTLYRLTDRGQLGAGLAPKDTHA